jgi:ABC-2 type transport system permease protein
MPLMFASNTFFPIKMMPEWIQAIANVNPLTYLTDALGSLRYCSLDISALIMDFHIPRHIRCSALAIIGVVLSWRYLTK